MSNICETMKKKTIRIALLIMLVLDIVFISPMIILARYDVPTYDDFWYGYQTHATWDQSKSILQTIETGIARTKSTYETWQGSFAAVFLMTMSPAVFDERIYGITFIIVLLGLSVSSWILIKTVLYSLLHCTSRWICIAIWLLSLFLNTQIIPDAAEGFYWFNGAIYYNFFFSLMLFFFAAILKLYTNKRTGKEWIVLLVSCIFAIIIGAGNYVTALISSEIMIILVCVSYIRKSLARAKLTVILVMLLSSFLFSALAPGNQIRAQYFEQLTPIEAIIRSFAYFPQEVIEHLNGMEIFVAIMCMPIIWCMAKESDCSFSYLLPVVIVSTCLLISQYTPLLYATGGSFPKRMQVIHCYQFRIWYVFIIFYIFGWIQRKTKFCERSYNIFGYLHKHAKAIIVLVVLGGLLVGYSVMNSMTGIKAINILRSDSIHVFEKETLERRAVLIDSDLENVVLKKYTEIPELFHVVEGDASEQSTANICYKEFYRKKSVVFE